MIPFLWFVIKQQNAWELLKPTWQGGAPNRHSRQRPLDKIRLLFRDGFKIPLAIRTPSIFSSERIPPQGEPEPVLIVCRRSHLLQTGTGCSCNYLRLPKSESILKNLLPLLRLYLSAFLALVLIAAMRSREVTILAIFFFLSACSERYSTE